jgi:hypothetical protein
MYPKQGVMNPNFTITQRAAGANFSVDISAMGAAVQGTSISNQGSYFVLNTGTVNLSTPSAPASGTRTHRVVAQLLDKQATGTQYGWQFLLKEDTGTGLPALPANSVDLGRVSIAAGQASVQNANITQTWELASRWTGGPTSGAPVCSIYQTVSQTVNANTWTDITCTGEEWDPMGMHSTSSNTARVTIQIPGPYYLNGAVAFGTLDSNTTAGTIALAACFGVNGTNMDQSTSATMNTNLVGDTSVVSPRPRTIYLNRGDYVTLRGRQQWTSSMGTQNARADCRSSLQVWYAD